MDEILECFEKIVNKNANKIAVIDRESKTTFKQLHNHIVNIAESIIKKIDNNKNKPIAILLDKDVNCIEVMIGVLYSGNFYTPIDIKFPEKRIIKILEQLNPLLIVTVKKYSCKLDCFNINDENILYLDDIKDRCILEVFDFSNNINENDPAYTLFTSGSTGIPKGVITSRYTLNAYIDWIIKEFDIDNETIIGNQAPFNYVNSIVDIFSMLKSGATLNIIPERLFTFPKKLMMYVVENKINFIFWVPSILCMVADMDILAEISCSNLNKILFCGEQMPIRQFIYLQKHLPSVEFVNLYGSTETTDASCYFRIKELLNESSCIPIGKPRDNVYSLVIDDEGNIVKQNGKGELYIGGSCLSIGYYNDFNRTQDSFIQEPKNDTYDNKYFKTGDIVEVNNLGYMDFICRKDSQIKHMGHRIELGEIETAIYSLNIIEKCCVLYNSDKKQIILYYQNVKEIEELFIINELRVILPKYMLPSKIHYFNKLPLNNNGKVDRNYLINSK